MNIKYLLSFITLDDVNSARKSEALKANADKAVELGVKTREEADKALEPISPEAWKLENPEGRAPFSLGYEVKVGKESARLEPNILTDTNVLEMTEAEVRKMFGEDFDDVIDTLVGSANAAGKQLSNAANAANAKEL